LVGHVMVAKLKPQEMETVKSMRNVMKASAIISKIKPDDPNNLSSLSTIRSALATIKRMKWDEINFHSKHPRWLMVRRSWRRKYLHEYSSTNHYGWVNNNHFISLRLTDDCPLPAL
ncbi:hypothetical protein MKX01_025261, partial [Papaver californicum]